MRGQRRRLPVKALGYVMSTKVIFRQAEVFVLAEVCLPRRPHAGQPTSLGNRKEKKKFRESQSKTACGRLGRQTSARTKTVPSFSLASASEVFINVLGK